MSYPLKVIEPIILGTLAMKADYATSIRRGDADFVIIQPLPPWKDIYAFYEKPDAEIRRSTVSMGLFHLIDRELSGIHVVDGLSCKPYFQNKTFVTNFLRLCVNDKGILSLAFTIINSIKDKSWIKTREQLLSHFEYISGTDAYAILKHADKIPTRIADEILKLDLLRDSFDLRQTVRSKSPILLRKDQFDLFLERIQCLICEALWKQENKRVSSASFDSIFDFHQKPTLLFEENLIVLLSKLENGDQSHYIDDLFDYYSAKLAEGLASPADYQLITEDHVRRLHKLAGIHSYDLIEKTSSILAESTNDTQIKELIYNRIRFWSLFKDEFVSIRIFLRKKLIEDNEVFKKRKDLKVSLTYSTYIIKFDSFWFVQFLEKKSGVTYGFYFVKDNPFIEQIFHSDIFSRETVKLIRRQADMYTKHGPDWQNCLAQYFEEEHEFTIPGRHSYLHNTPRKPGGELTINDLNEYDPDDN